MAGPTLHQSTARTHTGPNNLNPGDIMTAAATVTLELLPPGDLILDENVRKDAQLDKEFLASIKERGVIEPVIGYQPDGEGGSVHVVRGLRRTLGSIAVNRETIPVLVYHGSQPPDKDRLVDQLVENIHRSGLTNPELAAAVQQLTLVGLSARQIAKLTATSKETVAAAAKVAESPRALAASTQLSLVDAAVLAEFEDDEAAMTRLLRQIEVGGSLVHIAARLRQDREERAELARTVADYRATHPGVTVLDSAPVWNDPDTAKLTDLRDEHGNNLDPDHHAANCPGHVVWLHLGWDPDNDDGVWEVIAGCGVPGAPWKDHGHQPRLARGGTVPGKPADDDEAKAKATRERRHVIRSNKDWKAATTVRLEWLLGFSRRKTAPQGAEAFLAGVLDHGGPLKTYEAREVLGISTSSDLNSGRGAFADELPTAKPGRALVIAVALALASWEADISRVPLWRDSWRQPRAAVILQTLAGWGYGLAPIEERIIAGTATEPLPEEVAAAG